MFVLSSRGSPGVVEFETLIAEVGLAVSAALRGLQRLRRFTEAAHDGDAAQTYCVPVPTGQTCVHGDKSMSMRIMSSSNCGLLISVVSLQLLDLDTSPAAALLVHPTQ